MSAPSDPSDVYIRTARTPEEVDAAQALRYRVFYEEEGAHADEETARTKRDVDEFDAVAEHLLVIDKAMEDGPKGVVGTYRMLHQDAAEKHGRFYSESEFDLTTLKSSGNSLMEVGRSCVDPEHRTRAVMQKLWQALAEYVTDNNIDVLFGCASFNGTDITPFKTLLTYLYDHHLASEDVRTRTHEKDFVPLAYHEDVGEYDPKRVLAQMPPLVKGYLRLGGFVGDGAYIDAQFNTVDVLIMVQINKLSDRYRKHYARTTDGFSETEKK